jgi:putative ABC transport system ATP-binding protein
MMDVADELEVARPVTPLAGPLVRASSLTKTYGMGAVRVGALRGLDLTVGSGEHVAVTGPSGCGKSTLLHLLAGLTTPTSGELFVDGRELSRLRDAERTDLRRRTIGLVFQRFNLLPHLTVEQNIALAQRIADGRWRKGSEAVLALMERLGMAGKAGRRPKELSGGEQQRVAIARALVNRPKLLLADEPTGSLDSENAAAVLEVLSDLNERYGQTIVMITHDPEAAARCRRTVRMRDGRIHG